METAPPGSWPICSLSELPARLAQSRWCLAEFWAPDCLFSRLLAPIRAQLPHRLGDRVQMICCVLNSVETSAAAFGADALPALVLFKETRRVQRWFGAMDASLLEFKIAFAMADLGP